MIFIPIIMPQSIVALEAATTVKLKKSSLNLYTGSKYQLQVTGTKSKVRWTSSNKAVATVISNGLVDAKKAGTATITATVGSKKYTCKVTIEKAVTYEIINTEQGSVIVVKNNTGYGAIIEVDMSYFDTKGTLVYGYGEKLYNIGAGKKSVIVFPKPINEATNKPVKNLQFGIINLISQTEDTSSYVMTDKVKASVNKFNDNEADFSLTSDKLKGEYFIAGYAIFYKGNKIAAVTPFSYYQAKFGKSESYDFSL